MKKLFIILCALLFSCSDTIESTYSKDINICPNCGALQSAHKTVWVKDMYGNYSFRVVCWNSFLVTTK